MFVRSNLTFHISRDTSRLQALPRLGEGPHLPTLELPQEARVTDTARVEVIITGGEAADLMAEAQILGEAEVPAPAVRQTGEAGLRLTRVVRGTVVSSSLAQDWPPAVINTNYFQTKSH